MQLLKSLSAASTKAAGPNRGAEITRDVLKSGQIKIINNQVMLYGDAVTGLIQNGYMKNADLYSIIQYIVRKALRAKYFNYAVKDEKALTDYLMLKGPGANEASLKESRIVRTKALVDTKHAEIDKILKNPNPKQTFKSWAESAYTYKLLTGERMIQKIAGLNPITYLFVLPPNQVEVKSADDYLGISEYLYTPTQAKFRPEEIHFSKLFHPSINGYGEELRGLSPLRVAAMLIQKSNEGVLSGVKQYQNGGPPGILSLTDEDVALTPEQAAQYEDVIARKSGSANRGRVNITGMKAEWVKMGLSPVDLDVQESVLSDLRGLCRVYGLDSKLFNDPAASTMNNVTEAGKAAIVNAVIPAVDDLADDLNQIIEPFNIRGQRNFIDADVTHFPELAADLDVVMNRMMKGPFTPNQVLEAMHYEARMEPIMNEPWFDNNRTPLSQFIAPDIEPADPTKAGY